MPITGLINKPASFADSLFGKNELLDSIAENRYKQSLAANQQQQEERLRQMMPSEIALRQAQTQSELANANPELLKAKIEAEKALAHQRNTYTPGGRGGSVGLKDQMSLMQQVVNDIPGTDMQKANEITNAWLSGENTLPSGEPVPEPSGNAAVLLDRINKGRTTAGAMNTMLNAQGAEAEVKTLSALSNEWMEPYGDTILNMNPDQIMDTFKSDDESQKKLGKFIAAQALQYDIAPARSRLAGASPGVTLTNELVNVGMQNISARYPRLSAKARKYANEYINEGLEKGFQARKNVGITASSVFKKQAPKAENQQAVPENAPTQTAPAKNAVTFVRDKNGKLVRQK